MNIDSHNIIIVDQKIGDVTGDGIYDTVYLIAKKTDYPDSPFLHNIRIIIIDGKNYHLHEITFPNNAGYNPRLFLGPFMTKGIDDILVSIDSGGSGGFGYYYLYSYYNDIERLLFDGDQFNEWFKYQVNYEDDYKVRVFNVTLNQEAIIDISNKNIDYLDDLYTQDGHLKKQIKGEVLGLNNLYPIDINADGIYDLYTLNRVIGLYGADTLGHIESYLIWNKNRFTPMNNQYMNVSLTDIKDNMIK